MQCQAKAKSSGNQCNRRAVTGKRVCTVHGGLTPGGIASPHFKTGRYSKYTPARLVESYDDYRTDPDLLSLNDDVALLRSITTQHLQAMEQGETSPAWIDAKKAFDEMETAGALGAAGYEKYIAAKLKLQLIIDPNYRAAIAEAKVIRNIDQLSKVVDKERRLMIDKQQMITVAEANYLTKIIVKALLESVQKFCDESTASRILLYVQTAYSEGTSSKRDLAVIEAG